MSPAEILNELTKLARRTGLAVRMEPFDLRILEGRGGLCRLNGRPVVVLDAALPVLDKIAILADALSTLERAAGIPEATRETTDGKVTATAALAAATDDGEVPEAIRAILDARALARETREARVRATATPRRRMRLVRGGGGT